MSTTRLLPALLTDGTQTILDAADTFTAGIDGDFLKWDGCLQRVATPETPAAVFELIADATFEQMLEGLNSDLDGLFWQSTDQITKFIANYQDCLRTDTWANFFPFKGVGEKKFVANVCLYWNGPGAADHRW